VGASSPWSGRAGISTFDLSRYMGANLTRIDRQYGRLARDGLEHAIRLFDELSAEQRPRWTLVDAAWTPEGPIVVQADNGKSANQEQSGSPLTDSNRRPPPYHGGFGAALAGMAGHSRSRFSCKSQPTGVSLVPARVRACSV